MYNLKHLALTTFLSLFMTSRYNGRPYRDDDDDDDNDDGDDGDDPCCNHHTLSFGL